MPKGSNYLTIGWKQVFLALKEVRYLPQTFTYLLAFFLLADGLNTTGTLVSIIQNDIVSFSFLEITYLGLCQAACSTFSTFGYWHIQKYFSIKTKSMFVFTNIFSVLIPLYGMLGLWTTDIGYHHVRDFWIYNVVFGHFQAPYYSYAQTMMSEVTPRGYEAMFFGLFGITNRAVSNRLLPWHLGTADASHSPRSLVQTLFRPSSIAQTTTGWASRSYSHCAQGLA